MNTTGHFASDKTGAKKDIVEGAYAGFGLQGAVSLQANRAEDLAGPFDTESVDAGALWPVDVQYEWAHGENPSMDVITFAPPIGSAGIGLDYTRMTTNTQSRTFWSLDNGWGWAP